MKIFKRFHVFQKHKQQKKKIYINETSSEFKTSVLQNTSSKKTKRQSTDHNENSHQYFVFKKSFENDHLTKT